MRACLQRRVSTASCRGTRRERPVLNGERQPPAGEREAPCEVAVWNESSRLLPPIPLNGEILLLRYTRRNGTRSLAHDVV